MELVDYVLSLINPEGIEILEAEQKSSVVWNTDKDGVDITDDLFCGKCRYNDIEYYFEIPLYMKNGKEHKNRFKMVKVQRISDGNLSEDYNEDESLAKACESFELEMEMQRIWNEMRELPNKSSQGLKDFCKEHHAEIVELAMPYHEKNPRCKWINELIETGYTNTQNIAALERGACPGCGIHCEVVEGPQYRPEHGPKWKAMGCEEENKRSWEIHLKGEKLQKQYDALWKKRYKSPAEEILGK